MKQSMEDPFSEERINAEMKAWMGILTGYVPSSGYRNGTGSTARILDIGCAIPIYVPLLLKFFGDGSEESMQKNGAEYMGIDTAKSFIETARGIFAELPQVSFYAEDGRKIPGLIKKPVDVIVSSNVQVVHPLGGLDTQIEEIMQTSPGVHRQGGLLVYTFYSGQEQERAAEVLKSNYRLSFSGKNRYVTNPAENGYRHGFVVVGIRK